MSDDEGTPQSPQTPAQQEPTESTGRPAEPDNILFKGSDGPKERPLNPVEKRSNDE